MAMGVDSIQPTQANTDDAPQPKPASPNSKVVAKIGRMRRVISHPTATRRPRSLNQQIKLTLTPHAVRPAIANVQYINSPQAVR